MRDGPWLRQHEHSVAFVPDNIRSQASAS